MGSSWQGKILGFLEFLRKLLPVLLKAAGAGFIFRQVVTECGLDFFMKTYSPAETAFRNFYGSSCLQQPSGDFRV